MLGKVKPKAGWTWLADGKHPAAKDFLTIGLREPLLRALIDWASTGFQQLSAGKKPAFAGNSWRFWTGGNRRSHIICGLMRDSCDSFGRSFPLTVLGSGPLKGWEDHWELLPLVLDKTWQQIEYLATKRHLDFNQLENEVQMLPVPTNNGLESDAAARLAGRVAAASGRSPEMDRARATQITAGAPDAQLDIISLPNLSQADPTAHIAGLQAMLKKRSPHAPNAVFIGGIPAKSWLVLFKRPLRPNDFAKLWSLCSEEVVAPARV